MISGADLGGVQGVYPPPDDLRFSITSGLLVLK